MIETTETEKKLKLQHCYNMNCQSCPSQSGGPLTPEDALNILISDTFTDELWSGYTLMKPDSEQERVSSLEFFNLRRTFRTEGHTITRVMSLGWDSLPEGWIGSVYRVDSQLFSVSNNEDTANFKYSVKEGIVTARRNMEVVKAPPNQMHLTPAAEKIVKDLAHHLNSRKRRTSLNGLSKMIEDAGYAVEFTHYTIKNSGKHVTIILSPDGKRYEVSIGPHYPSPDKKALYVRVVRLIADIETENVFIPNPVCEGTPK